MCPPSPLGLKVDIIEGKTEPEPECTKIALILSLALLWFTQTNLLEPSNLRTTLIMI